MTIKPILAITAVFTFFAFANSSTAHAEGFLDSLKNKWDVATDSSLRNRNTYQEVADKQLVDAFYILSADAKTQGMKPEIAAKPDQYEFLKLTPESLTFREYLYKADQMSDLIYTMK